MKIVMLFGVCSCLVFASSGFAQQTPQSLADAELPSLLGMYKDIHAHPELSGQEERTAALVAKELRATGCEVTEHQQRVFFKFHSQTNFLSFRPKSRNL